VPPRSAGREGLLELYGRSLAGQQKSSHTSNAWWTVGSMSPDHGDAVRMSRFKALIDQHVSGSAVLSIGDDWLEAHHDIEIEAEADPGDRSAAAA
jgi:hypothetical protein